MRFPFQLLKSRVIRGRKDPARQFLIIEGVITLTDGGQAYMEAIMNESRVYAPGQYALEVDLDTDRDRRLTAFVRGLQPLSAPQQPAKGQ